MKSAFSTLACPEWTMPQIVTAAAQSGYDGIELRFVENEDSLWKLPDFRGERLAVTRRVLFDHGLTICCLDTSCRFHFPDPQERRNWIAEGERMAELAAQLGAPGIRVFGDQIQPGADRDSTRNWIAESIRTLAEKISPQGVEVWVETHGDFASAPETMAIVLEADMQNIGVIWDPANCFADHHETPASGAVGLNSALRHVHVKDMLSRQKSSQLVLTGEGNFPLSEVVSSLRQLDYDGFLSFEWEKKWHPEIPDATIALPHFSRWFQENIPQ